MQYANEGAFYFFSTIVILILGKPFSVVKKPNDKDTIPNILPNQPERNARSSFRGEAISVDTEEDIFYIPRSALYDSNMSETGPWGPSAPSGTWGPSAPSAPSGPSGPSGTPIPPGARLVTWRHDMKKAKTESAPRQRYQPSTPAMRKIVTWVPRVGSKGTGGEQQAAGSGV